MKSGRMSKKKGGEDGRGLKSIILGRGRRGLVAAIVAKKRALFVVLGEFWACEKADERVEWGIICVSA